MRINHNIAALNTYNKLSANQASTSKNLEKLSSGLKINRAGDNAAGLAISEKMRGQISGLDQASANASDGISLIQTAEGGLKETQSILQRMRELAVQSANDTNEDVDRTAIQTEMNQLTQEIDRIAETTEFNNKKLLNGNITNVNLQIGANDNQKLTIAIKDMSASSATSELKVGTAATTAASVSDFATVTETAADTLVEGGISLADYDQANNLDIKIEVNTAGTAGSKATFDVTINGITKAGIEADADGVQGVLTLDATKFDVFDGANKITITPAKDWAVADEWNAEITGKTDKVTGPAVDTHGNAESAITKIDEAIKSVSSERSNLGAWQNRLEHTINNLGTSSENLSAAESRIRDVDMAKEMTEFTKNNILSQAAQAMLAQANQQPQGVLQLLQ